jgi:biopolymer transport protein ExbD
MNLRDRKQALVAEINITPFTDVILVLLIIFMITTPLLIQSSIKVNLPKAGSAKSAGSSDQVNITVTEKSLMYLDGTLVTKRELKEKISEMYKRNPAIKVMLFSDKSARFVDIVAALDVLNAVGVRDLNIAAKTGSGDK